ncbi:hypothetical protein V9K67_18460 [Paraflavisolibacter sp. H34]|uniref:hypothetical protein n=1 Tax=Huijunlia imazamoxiresistens TaxID=3127457 RepID=UPI00301B4E45
MTRKTIRPGIAVLAALLFQACESSQPEPFASLLKPCDQVDIVLYNGGDTLTFNTKDTTGVEIFVKLIHGGTKSAADGCSPTGELRYLAQGHPLLTAPFAAPEGSGKKDCNFVTYEAGQVKYRHPLTERAHNILKQVYQAPQPPKPQLAPPQLQDSAPPPQQEPQKR